MASWGAKLYQDDVAEDVRDYYKDQLKRGKTNEEVTSELLIDNEDVISDDDEAPVFWFALADTQWNLGRLLPFVKEKALKYLKGGTNLTRWEKEAINQGEYKVREKVLQELEQKLKSPMPAEKKISQYKLYKCEWNIGDIYAYKLESDYAKQKRMNGEYFLVQKVDEGIWHPGHIIPIVRVKITTNGMLPQTATEFDDLEYVQTSVTKYGDRLLPIDASCSYEEQIAEKSKIKYEVDEFGLLPHFRLKLISTSKRSIPKNLLFVENFKNVKPPIKEFVPHCKLSIDTTSWKDFEKKIIDQYYGYNLRQYQIYKNKK